MMMMDVDYSSFQLMQTQLICARRLLGMQNVPPPSIMEIIQAYYNLIRDRVIVLVSGLTSRSNNRTIKKKKKKKKRTKKQDDDDDGNDDDDDDDDDDNDNDNDNRLRREMMTRTCLAFIRKEWRILPRLLSSSAGHGSRAAGRLVSGGVDEAMGITSKSFLLTSHGLLRTTDMLFPRAYHCVVILNTQVAMALAGAVTFSAGSLIGSDSVEFFSFDTQTWSHTNPLSTAPGGGRPLRMRTKRHAFAAVVLHDRRVLVIGGIVNGMCSDSCEIYNPTSDIFSFARPLNYGRCHHAAAVISASLVIVTGGNRTHSCSNTCEVYNVYTNRWLVIGKLNTWRCNHLCVCLSSSLSETCVVVAGGSNGEDKLQTTEIMRINFNNQENNNLYDGEDAVHAVAAAHWTILDSGTKGFPSSGRSQAAVVVF